ncbi:hypothetical protein PVAP13_4KG018558 [Panicum virgatum]|uniref:Uncharacterized protein n=1 Tax=Panicum virgatum TaxID=38727 RepID=A0A8T0TKD3_PANVG|nr:hypothetical protein PVAP13_4KG018558 [Panicum virgatum]
MHGPGWMRRTAGQAWRRRGEQDGNGAVDKTTSAGAGRQRRGGQDDGMPGSGAPASPSGGRGGDLRQGARGGWRGRPARRAAQAARATCAASGAAACAVAGRRARQQAGDGQGPRLSSSSAAATMARLCCRIKSRHRPRTPAALPVPAFLVLGAGPRTPCRPSPRCGVDRAREAEERRGEGGRDGGGAAAGSGATGRHGARPARAGSGRRRAAVATGHRSGASSSSARGGGALGSPPASRVGGASPAGRERAADRGAAWWVDPWRGAAAAAVFGTSSSAASLSTYASSMSGGGGGHCGSSSPPTPADSGGPRLRAPLLLSPSGRALSGDHDLRRRPSLSPLAGRVVAMARECAGPAPRGAYRSSSAHA